MDNKIFFKKNTIDGGFLQSEYWQKFQESVGKDALIFDEENFKLRAFRHSLPVARDYFFVPRGPVFSSEITDNNLKEILDKTITECKKRKAGWIRIEPQSRNDFEKIKKVLGKKWCMKKSKKNHEPAQALMLDLKKSEEELLADMKQKTRYNIRLAGKKGVQIRVSENPEKDVEMFYELSTETAERDGIGIHPLEYYREMVAGINSEHIKLYLAEHDGKVIGAIIVTFFGGVVTYLHGASSNAYRNVMANYLIQWVAIQDAKNQGYEKYDFGGINIKEDNSWQGITRFKLGFCPEGQIIDFPGCWDIVINKRRYFIYRVLQYFKDILN